MSESKAIKARMDGKNQYTAISKSEIEDKVISSFFMQHWGIFSFAMTGSAPGTMDNAAVPFTYDAHADAFASRGNGSAIEHLPVKARRSSGSLGRGVLFIRDRHRLFNNLRNLPCNM